MTVDLTKEQIEWILQQIEDTKDNARVSGTLGNCYDWDLRRFEMDEDEFDALKQLYDALRPGVTQ